MDKYSFYTILSERKCRAARRGGHTARNITNTITPPVNNAVQQVMLPAYPTVSFRANHRRGDNPSQEKHLWYGLIHLPGSRSSRKR